MGIRERFNDVATDYDKNRKRFIPCFDDFYGTATDFIAANITAPAKVLDLGAGTGLLTAFWREHFPDAAYELVDIAEAMLTVARTRFSDAQGVSFRTMNYADNFPDGRFDAVISALSIHHLEDDDKRLLFSRIHERLSEGGIFANYDQFCADGARMDAWYTAYWEKQLYASGLTEADIAAWKERKIFDRECSVEKELAMLRGGGFSAAQCVYTCQKFSVIMAMK